MSNEHIALMSFCITLSLMVIFSPDYKLVYKINKKC